MTIRYIDIHAHVNFAAFNEDREAVFMHAEEAGVAMINVGTKLSTSREAVEMTEKHPNAWAIIGLHPIHTDVSFHDKQEIGEGSNAFTSKGEVFDSSAYRELIRTGKVVGIGECGLDFYRTTTESLEKQKTAFHSQVQLALEHDLPLMLHVRASKGTMDAYEEVIRILGPYKKDYGAKLRGDVHFFAGTTDVAQKFLDIGFDLSFTGVITFAKEYVELVKFVPLDRMHAETDCPFVTPVPYRGKRNEPAYVIEVVKKIAEIKGITLEEASTQLVANAKRLFNISLT